MWQFCRTTTPCRGMPHFLECEFLSMDKSPRVSPRVSPKAFERGNVYVTVILDTVTSFDISKTDSLTGATILHICVG